MKIPQKPPHYDSIWKDIIKDPKRAQFLLSARFELPTTDRYAHWDKLRFYPPPDGLTPQEWWFLIKLERRGLYKRLPLKDKLNNPFNYIAGIDPIPERLHEIDQGAGGFIKMPEQITNPATRDQYYVESLIREAITSSQLEGAATTRKIAKEMIRTGRRPRDRSERMIFNNFRTMQRIGQIKDRPLSKDLVFELHRLVTEDTLDTPAAAGRFRRDDERIVIADMYNEVFHDPPPAIQLEERMRIMCEFANEENPAGFIHPVIRSIILHFWLAYDHPFVDGNGRTARALFYWSMLKHGYWLFEFVSISQIIIKSPAMYGRAFLYTETDENDLTYFILFHLDIMRKAIIDLHEYLHRKVERLNAVENQMRSFGGLNHRQRALVSHALRHPHHKYTIKSHRVCHDVVYQTARADLLDLESKGLFVADRQQKQTYFKAVADMENRLVHLDE